MALDKRKVTKFDFTIYQGTTLRLVIRCHDSETGEPMDLTGYTVRSQMRVNFDDAEPAAVFNASFVDAANGAIMLHLSPEQTSALNFTRANYDVEIDDGAGGVDRVVMGVVTLSKEVTK